MADIDSFAPKSAFDQTPKMSELLLKLGQDATPAMPRKIEQPHEPLLKKVETTGTEQEKKGVAASAGKEQDKKGIAESAGKNQEKKGIAEPAGKDQDKNGIASPAGKDQEKNVSAGSGGKEQDKKDSNDSAGKAQDQKGIAEPVKAAEGAKPILLDPTGKYEVFIPKLAPQADLDRLKELALGGAGKNPAAVAPVDQAKEAALLKGPDKAAEQKSPEFKSDIASQAARDQVLGLLSVEDRKNLDIMRFELAAGSTPKEREQKQAEITSFLGSKLSKEILPPNGVAEILRPQSSADLLSEIKIVRPAELDGLVQSVRSKLVTEAEKVITNKAEQKAFNERLVAFEARATGCNLSQSEILNNYLQVGRILNPNIELPHGGRALLAGSMIANSADSSSIDQGAHNTCNVTTLECRLYAQEPSTANRLVADVAITGAFVTADGTTVKPRDLAPDNESVLGSYTDGLRNYASQIFQLTAINCYWSRKDTLPGGKTVGKGNILYGQDGGEALWDYSVNPPERQGFKTIGSSQPWLDIFRLSEINQQITGRPSKDLGIKRWGYSSESEGVSQVFSLGRFKERLTEMQNKNAFPVIIEVDAGKKPFGDGKDYGPHVVTITHYDAESGLVTIDNQWGKGGDFTGLPGQRPKVEASEIFATMSPIPSTAYMWKRVKDGFDGIKVSDAYEPSKAALSTQLLEWGVKGGAPLAVRGGLGYLDRMGVSAAGKILTASETKLGSVALRAGTGLAAFGVFAYANDLPGAFKLGNSHGVGKLTRTTLDFASFGIGQKITSKAMSLVGLGWAPARIGVSLLAGAALSTYADKMGGEGAEVAGSFLYDRARELWEPNKPMIPPVVRNFEPSKPANLAPLTQPQTMQNAFKFQPRPAAPSTFNPTGLRSVVGP